MLVGNDVVDLGDPENQPDAIHPRFDQRVFSAVERSRYLTLPSMHRTRWAMWAAKESAFKVARKLDPGVRFHPREFAVRFVRGRRARVEHSSGAYDVWLEMRRDWIHAIATPAGRFRRCPDFRLAPVEAGIGGRDVLGFTRPWLRPGRRVRELARAAVGSRFGRDPSELEVSSENGIPGLRWRGRRFPVDLSLSHHGRFVACAWGSLKGLRSREYPTES